MDKRVGVASAWGSATVVNAIAAGKGAAFGVKLKVQAKVELVEGFGKITGRVVGERMESPKLIEICVQKVLKHFGLDRTYDARVETKSEVPIAVGLSSSSAAANAAVLATFAALGRKPRPKLVLDLGIDAAFEAGVTITGALDDAAASLYGCGVVTDNLKRRVLRRFKVDPKLKVVIYVPPSRSYTSKINRARLRPIRAGVELAHCMALRGEVWGALTFNGLLYSSALGQDPLPALEAMARGALAAGLTGTGPATVAIAKPAAANAIERAWRARPGKVIVTKPTVKGAQVERP
ncbi:MAG: shikimate kinase [Candidatus Hodarchaeaceae archaeon]|nr:shikimate kinase [Candidatus Hodarchaeaceae archaeon]